MYQVLIVDDEERIRRTFKRLLERKGYQTLVASNASDAKEIIVKDRSIDLMLLDINMGEVDGDILFEVAHAFHPQIKIIVSSVYPLEEQHELIHGADDYYDKSESLSVLLEKMDTLSNSESEKLPEKTILVIDDDQKVRKIYHDLLTNAGYNTLEVSDNDKVFDFLRKQVKKIDLIILDLFMPSIMGDDIYETIKTKYLDIKVIIASNYDVDEQEIRIFDADDYYDKSDSNDVLLKKVNDLFEEKKVLKKVKSK